MKKYKVQQVILCEVRVWGFVEADNLHDALDKAIELGVSHWRYDQEVLDEKETLSLSIETFNPVKANLPDDGLAERLLALI